MSTTSSPLVASSAIGGFASLASAYSQSQAASSQGAYQQSQDEANARNSDLQAADAIRRGETTANDVAKNGAKVVGSQKASLAAQGVDVNDGSAAQVTSETQAAVDQDTRTARSNAWREAWGYKVQSNNQRTAGKIAGITGEAQSQSTLLTGGMNAVSYGLRGMYDYKKGS